MPGFVEQVLVVCGNEEEIYRFRKAVGIDKGGFNLNSILPIPTEIFEIEASDPAGQESEGSGSWRWGDDGNKEFLSKFKHDRLMKQYGFDNWSDWCIKNWGCKWNTRDVSIRFDQPEKIAVYYTTPDSPSTGIYQALAGLGYEVGGMWLDDEGNNGMIFGDAKGALLARTVKYQA